MSDELKPCPFCGGEPWFSPRQFKVLCKSCGANRPDGGVTSAEHWAGWNARTDSQRDARIEELEEAMKAVIEGDYPQVIGKHFNRDGSYSKHDECSHGLPLYNGCVNCIDEYLQSVLTSKAT